MFDLVLCFVKVVAASVVGDAKQVGLNLRGFADGDTDDTEAETSNEEPVFGTPAVIFRPKAADTNGFAEYIAARAGDFLRPIAGRDLRISKARGNVKEGAGSLAGYGGAFVNVEPAASGTGDTVQIYVPFQHDGGGPGLGAPAKAHAIIVDPATGNESIGVVHADGHCLLLTSAKEAMLKSANGQNAIIVSDAGVALSGLISLVGGIVAGNVTVAQPVALYPATAALATALTAYLAAVRAILLAIPTPPTSPQQTALTTAEGALATAIALVATPATGGSVTLKASPL